MGKSVEDYEALSQEANGRKKVAIILLEKPNFEEIALKYFILNLNCIQSCFEFEFPDIDEYPFEENKPDVSVDHLIRFFEVIEEKELSADFYIGIRKSIIPGNLFWEAKNNICILTTADWKKNFSPPSVFEFIINSMAGSLIAMTAMLNNKPRFGSHKQTRGCFFDYTRKKEEDRIDIALGYICDDCKKNILTYLGKDYLECVKSIIEMKWLGDSEDKNTVANRMKKYFRIDLNKDTGYFKSRKEKVVEYIVGLSKEITSLTVTTIIAFIIGFILGQA